MKKPAIGPGNRSAWFGAWWRRHLARETGCLISLPVPARWGCCHTARQKFCSGRSEPTGHRCDDQATARRGSIQSLVTVPEHLEIRGGLGFNGFHYMPRRGVLTELIRFTRSVVVRRPGNQQIVLFSELPQPGFAAPAIIAMLDFHTR